MPCGFARSHRQDAMNPLLQPTFRVTSTRTEIPSSEPARRAPWETRRYSTFQSPTTSCLTARRRLWAEQQSTVLYRPWREKRGSLFGCLALRRSNPLTLLRRVRVGLPKFGPFSHSLSPLSPGHVNAAGARDELEVPSIEEVRGQTLSRELVPERCHAWPVVAGAAPVHRCFKKLRLDSWPRRCSRALQGRVRFYDFCRRIFQRAQSRTARTFQSLDPENP